MDKKNYEYMEHHVEGKDVKMDGFTLEVDPDTTDEEIDEILDDLMKE